MHSWAPSGKLIRKLLVLSDIEGGMIMNLKKKQKILEQAYLTRSFINLLKSMDHTSQHFENVL